MASKDWAINTFKGRLGEALVETALLEFGYEVIRSGREVNRKSGKRSSSLAERLLPDFAVTDPISKTTHFIEVKTRMSHPMSFLVDRAKLDSLREHYPDTILALVSSYNGSINCAMVNDLVKEKLEAAGRNFYKFDLTRPGWKPLWHFFPLVKHSKRSETLWENIKAELGNFGCATFRSGTEPQIFEGEREVLAEYIEASWNPLMLTYDIPGNLSKDASLSDLWGTARKISAFMFFVRLLGEDAIDTHAFPLAMDKILGDLHESYLSINIWDLLAALGQYPEEFKQAMLLVERSKDAPKGGGFDFLDGLAEVLPPGVGKVYLGPGGTEPESGLKIDMRTAVALARRKNCLDRRS